jgi:hypothetical protein
VWLAFWPRYSLCQNKDISNMATLPRKGFSRALDKFYDWLENKAENGAIPAVTGLSFENQGVGPFCKTVLTFTNVVAYKGTKVYDFPAGAIAVLGAHADLALTKSSAGVIATWDGDFSLGTVTASNNATLASTEQNLIPTTATPQAVAGVTTAKGVSTATEGFKVLDGTVTPVDAYLNFLVDDADHDVTGTPCNLIVNGEVTIFWYNLGDV